MPWSTAKDHVPRWRSLSTSNWRLFLISRCHALVFRTMFERRPLSCTTPPYRSSSEWRSMLPPWWKSSKKGYFWSRSCSIDECLILLCRNIQLNTRLNLVEVRADSKEAIFDNLDQPGTIKSFKVSRVSLNRGQSTFHCPFSTICCTLVLQCNRSSSWLNLRWPMPMVS